MNSTHNKPGYILALTLALMALFMFLATYVSNKGLIFSSFAKTMIDREKARQLAYGGIQLAISQLAVQEENEKQEEKPEQSPNGKQLLKVILPNLGRLQKFNLKQNIEGVTGAIGIMITSEEGKININKMYDFEKHKFIGESMPGSKQEAKDDANMKKMLQELFTQIREQTGADLFAEFEKFLKERKYPINDVTELLAIKGFDVFKNNIYNDPSADQKKSNLYLADIFTISSSKQSIEPWLISESLGSLLKLQRNSEKISIDELLKTFKDKSDWKNDWNKSLKNVYGIEFAALPKYIVSLLNPAFNPKIFSVFSYATIGSVTVRLIALLEREEAGKNERAEVKIRNIYLL